MILSYLKEAKPKFKKLYKEKISNLINAIKLNNRYFDRKRRFKGA